MAANTFDDSLAHALVFEGGKVDDPHDPGGRTNQGVTQRVYSGWRIQQKLAPRDVYLMEAAERDAIYHDLFWLPISGDALPMGLDGVVFDAGVNSGTHQAGVWLQRALKMSKIDGAIGPATRAAANAPGLDVDATIAAFTDCRLAFCQSLKTWARYGRGWNARILAVEKHGQALAIGTAAPAPEYIAYSEKKASIDDRKTTPRWPADAGSAAGAASVTVGNVAAVVAPWAGFSDLAHRAVDFLASANLSLTAAGVLAGSAGAVYGRWASARERRLADALGLAPPVAAVTPSVQAVG